VEKIKNHKHKIEKTFEESIESLKEDKSKYLLGLLDIYAKLQEIELIEIAIKNKREE